MNSDSIENRLATFVVFRSVLPLYEYFNHDKKKRKEGNKIDQQCKCFNLLSGDKCFVHVLYI